MRALSIFAVLVLALAIALLVRDRMRAPDPVPVAAVEEEAPAVVPAEPATEETVAEEVAPAAGETAAEEAEADTPAPKEAKAEEAAPAAPPAPAFTYAGIEALTADLSARLVGRLDRRRAFAGEAAVTADALSAAVEAAAENGDFERELSALEALVAAPGADSESWLRLAEGYYWEGRMDDAAAAAFAGYRAGSDAQSQGAALFLLARAYQALEEDEGAIAALEAGLALVEDDEAAWRLDQLRDAAQFRVADVQVSADQLLPQACLVLSRPLAKPLPLPAADYVAVPAGEPLDVFTRTDAVCLGGLRHGRTYEVTLRAGLPAADGSSIAGDQTVTVAVGNRPPSVRLSTSAYVLPRTPDAAVPVTTVNLEALDLQLLRINDRNLVRTILSGMDSTDYGWLLEDIEAQTGELVWRGDAAVEAVANREVTTLIPFRDLVDETAPGVYLLAATARTEEPQDWREWSLQWLVVTDLGLTSFEGPGGTWVFARSLATGAPLGGVSVELLARNNAVLGRAETDAGGLAQFAPGLTRGTGGDRAAALLASAAAGDFSFLALIGPALDLSERGVAGRPAPGPLDAFLYSERGVYRPGETVSLAALLRDGAGAAVPGVPLTLRVLRADGILAFESVSEGDDLGGHMLPIPISATAPAGTWQVVALADPAGEAIGRLDFQVADFVPQRMELALSSDAEWLSPGETAPIEARGRFLYGAPAAGLTAEAELLLRADPDPYPDYPGYSFGLAQEDYVPLRRPLAAPDTDSDGLTVIALSLEALPDTTRPLIAATRVSLFDSGGRPVNREIAIPVRVRPLELGLRPLFAGGTVAQGAEAGFDTIALGPDGKPLGGRTVAYEWVQEYHDYQWYLAGDEWRYDVTITESVVGRGEVALDADGAARLARAFDWGRYRLEVYDPEGGSAASLRFRAGWWMADSPPDTPDALEITLDQADYASGGTVRAFLKAPFAGTALVTIVNDSVLFSRSIDLPAGGAEVELTVDSAWGTGAYVLASAFRPGNVAETRGPARAMGAAWLTIGRAERTLAVELTAPEEALPRGAVDIPVRVLGASAGPVRLTLAAVDEGILLLTDFATPDPAAHYLGQRRLGLDVRDLYGRLIQPAEGRRAQVRTGGDLARSRQLTGDLVTTRRTVALFEGPVTLDAGGRATVRLELPDFNGRLRLMAVAYGRLAVGSGEAALLVRDPVVAELLLPRFLAPGDVAQATVSLHNLSAPEGAYALLLDAEGGVGLSAEAPMDITLDSGQRVAQTVEVTGEEVGDGRLTLTLAGPDGFSLTRDWDISVRPAQPIVTIRVAETVEPGATATLTADLLAGVVPATARIGLTLATRPDIDVPALLEALNRYPYGCVEQTVSVALPLLYFPEMARAWGQALDEGSIAGRVAHAIRRTVDRQRGDGAFGMWSARGPAEPWLTAYAADFLGRARDQGHLVPEFAYARALGWLAEFMEWSSSAEELPARAYAMYVLAREGAVEPGRIRYWAETMGKIANDPLARAQVTLALTAVGEGADMVEGLRLAALTDTDSPYAYNSFGSPLRDGAAIIALMAEAGVAPALLMDAAEPVFSAYEDRRYLSTQEQARLLLAAHALEIAPGSALEVTVDGLPLVARRRPFRAEIPLASLAEGYAVTNRGAGPVRLYRTVSAAPTAPLPASEAGFSLTRGFYTLDGDRADLAAVRQNDVLLVVIEGESVTGQRGRALVVDLLPAGLEIESAAIGRGMAKTDLSFLPPLSTLAFEAGRDDRYLAAIDLAADDGRFIVAYLARAVTPGRYALPGAFVEDMYRPYQHARGALGEMTVLPRE